MPSPRQKYIDLDADGERAEALDNLARIVERRQRAEADELMAMRLAAANGASLRDIAERSDRSKDTVARMLRR